MQKVMATPGEHAMRGNEKSNHGRRASNVEAPEAAAEAAAVVAAAVQARLQL